MRISDLDIGMRFASDALPLNRAILCGIEFIGFTDGKANFKRLNGGEIFDLPIKIDQIYMSPNGFNGDVDMGRWKHLGNFNQIEDDVVFAEKMVKTERFDFDGRKSSLEYWNGKLEAVKW